MPLYLYGCDKCETEYEKIKPLANYLNDLCPQCGNITKLLPAAAAGYKIKGDNSASVTPKGSGCRRRKKKE